MYNDNIGGGLSFYEWPQALRSYKKELICRSNCRVLQFAQFATQCVAIFKNQIKLAQKLATVKPLPNSAVNFLASSFSIRSDSMRFRPLAGFSLVKSGFSGAVVKTIPRFWTNSTAPATTTSRARRRSPRRDRRPDRRASRAALRRNSRQPGSRRRAVRPHRRRCRTSALRSQGCGGAGCWALSQGFRIDNWHNKALAFDALLGLAA